MFRGAAGGIFRRHVLQFVWSTQLSRQISATASLTLIFNSPEDVSIHRVAKRGKMAGQRARPEDLDPEISRHRIMDSQKEHGTNSTGPSGKTDKVCRDRHKPTRGPDPGGAETNHVFGFSCTITETYKLVSATFRAHSFMR